jgi:alpha-ketoglutarate-dependent taurine dioxygenase
MSLEVIPLTDHVGSEIRVTPDQLLTPEVARQVREVLEQRGVLVFKQINLSDEQQRKLTGLMGNLRQEGDQGVLKITLDKKVSAGADYLKGSFLWHIDGTHDDIPVFGSLLSGRQLSSVGGQTEFANSYAAYEALPPAMKDRIAKLKVVHSVATSMRRAGVEETPQNLAYWASIPDRTHNLVWTHKTGRKSLVVGCHADHIVGMSLAEGRALLEELQAWATQPRFKYRHEWSVGDMLIWDNTGVLHRAEPYPVDSGRLMHRTTILGEEAFA